MCAEGSGVTLYEHQKKALSETEKLNRVAFYHPMGSGKTFTGSEKMALLDEKINLLVCQKSKVADWMDHFTTYYPKFEVYDLTDKRQMENYLTTKGQCVGIINYELTFRRPELKQLHNFTMMLDESSLIQNENAKRSRFIMKLDAKNVILLSGTPVGGKYENLWSQMQLVGWNIKKTLFYNQYIDYHYEDFSGFPQMIIDGYKNEERLKRKMREHGCNFLTEADLFDLPEQVHQTIRVPVTKEYKIFQRHYLVTVEGEEIVGDCTLTQMLRERQLCGIYNADKLEAYKDLLESTSDRIIVFYNFTEELRRMREVTERPVSVVNGEIKNLTAYENDADSVTFIQYQAGAMGLNLQKANKIIYFTPPLSSELFEQSKKRIHRINQNRNCYYYYLTCKNSIEERIYNTLAMRRDYTEALFENES